METGFKEVPASKRKTDWIVSLVFGALSLVVYGATLSHTVYPGESANLMATYSGVEAATLPLHPVWGTLVSWLSAMGGMASLPVRLNFFSALCLAAAVVLLYRLMSFLVYELITEEYAVEKAERAAVLAGATSALAFMFAAPVWLAAIRLQYQGFDILLALAAAALVMGYTKKRRMAFLMVAFVLLGVGVVESYIFIPLLPVFLVFAGGMMWKGEQLKLARVAAMGVCLLLGMSLYYFSARAFMATHDIASLGYETVLDVLVDVWRHQVQQLRLAVTRPSWLIIMGMSVLPWLVGGFAAPRALNNDRTWSQYILSFSLTVVVVMGLTNVPVAPWPLLKATGMLPVASYTMLAMTAGYVVAYWYLLMKVRYPRRDESITVVAKQTGEWLGLLLAYPLMVIAALMVVVNVFECRGSRGAFADRMAEEVIKRLDGRTWFVTDGMLDNHLAILARRQGVELNLICLQKDMNEYYLKSFTKRMEDKGFFEGAEGRALKNTLSLGIMPFLQDWFASDKEIHKKVAVFSFPDLWYIANMVPVPEFCFFGGSPDMETYREKPLLKEYTAFWDEMEKILPKPKEGDASSLGALNKEFRRHIGFVANNLGVMLEDLGNDEDAFAAYTFVYTRWDPDNISALFNRFEMARRGASVTDASKERIEKELRDFVSNLKRRYPLWSLSRYFGYVRSPELFARLGWGWALSGQTGAALSSLRRAADMMDASQRVNAMRAMANVYALADDKAKTESLYEEMVESNPDDRSAMLGLARLAVQEGALDKAKSWLERAAKVEGPDGQAGGNLGLEWAAVHLMNNDLAQARITLQQTTDTQPRNLQAWTMLAMIQLQQDELDEVERVTLPKMQGIAGSMDNYFVRVTQAQIALKKGGKNAKVIAREAFLRASALRPDVQNLKDIILQLDMDMDDKKAAELHARQVLRANRNHALANYVLGALRLQEGAYGDAEDFLRRSVTAKPTAEALNDLAECLRRIRRFAEAERFARQSLEINPNLYISWETLASILLDSDGDLDEAEKAINKAIEIEAIALETVNKDKNKDNDLRIQITKARILLQKGELERTREIVRRVRNRQEELSPYEREELDKLMERASSSK